MDDGLIRSRRLPGGDTIAAVLDRQVMGLADRGGASNLIGARWADLCAEFAADWPGRVSPVPGEAGPGLRVERVSRLDALPEVAAAASHRGLQNPDLLLFGSQDGVPTVQAADAKFSIETARSKQVSPGVVAGLLGLRDLLPHAFGEVVAAPRLVPGLFLSPDYPLTALMLRRRHGIVRTTVREDEVVLVPTSAAAFFARLEGAAVMAPLADVDTLPVGIAESLVVGLYYFRLARAAVGFWLDATKPLLLFHDPLAVDEGAIRAEAEVRAREAPSAFELILRWDADVQTVRNQRTAVDQVASLPILGRDLRPMVTALAEAMGADAPSANQVRRRVGAWWREQLRAQVGPIAPPVSDLPALLTNLGRVAASLAPSVEPQIAIVVQQLIERRDSDPSSPPTAVSAPEEVS